MANDTSRDASGKPLVPQGHTPNPFQLLISECEDDRKRLQDRYEAHRTSRTAQFQAKILDLNFRGWDVDEILKKLQSPETKGQFIDHRNNLAFWARPPRHIRDLVNEIQEEIRSVAPTLWFTPPEGLHMTTLEITNSLTESEIDAIVAQMPRGAIWDMVNYTLDHRARLVRPMISYDATAMALCFVPAAGEGAAGQHDQFTYHHLRRDLFDKMNATGVKAAARYTVPSAHVTIARFITQDGFLLGDAAEGQSGVDRARIQELINKIEEINRRLKAKYWPGEDGGIDCKGEWVVGQEKGLEFCKGRSWYGEGDRICLGKGF